MRYLITGGSGQLGFDVYRELINRGVPYYDIYKPTHEQFDITNWLNVLNDTLSFEPDVIFHCAAYTAVDKAENETEAAICKAVNEYGTQNITDAARRVGAKLIYLSTDYVFDGTKDGEYEIDDETHPLNYYGLTKRNGENIVKAYDKSFIFRISWVFGENGKNFIKTMLKLAETKDEVSVVNDQIGSPTYTEDLAKLLVDAANTDCYGVYHATNEGFMSWADVASKTFEVAGLDTVVNPILTSEYKRAATVPLNSRLSKSSLDAAGFKRLPDANDAIERYVKILTR